MLWRRALRQINSISFGWIFLNTDILLRLNRWIEEVWSKAGRDLHILDVWHTSRLAGVVFRPWYLKYHRQEKDQTVCLYFWNEIWIHMILALQRSEIDTELWSIIFLCNPGWTNDAAEREDLGVLIIVMTQLWECGTPCPRSALRWWSYWRQLFYAIKTQLKAPIARYFGYFFPFSLSLWHL